ncbi:MAG TPA: pyruvate dehydrogenase (acetyl-transferring) E1 component subunit alpha [Planctomycetota bacterium]|nr:pyruvate dehydrogenase (acetyl-transferring) E1 component subunit alpha [Planctomycetota bacterium]
MPVATEAPPASSAKPRKPAEAEKLIAEQQQEATDLWLHLYKEMLRIRRFEEQAFQQYQKGTIGGFCHLYIGQEAVCVGAISCLEKGDKVLTGYRDHGHALAMGMRADSLMAELFGKATGCAKGKGGSMHFFHNELGMMGGNGIVGSHIPVATGVAFAQKYKNEKNVTLAFYGDGAAQQGAVHEAMNLAGLWRLPIIFVLENNNYGMGTAVDRSSSTKDLYKRAVGYNFPGVTCDGMDVLVVRKCFSEAIARARHDNTPTLIEAKTYRYRGHSMSDPAAYRTPEEVDLKKKEDPILMLKAELLLRRVPDAQLAAIDDAAKHEAMESVAHAQAAPEPELVELARDVVANPWAANLLPKVEI